MQQRSSDWLIADFFTHSYRISGRIRVHTQKLADQLNSQTTSFVELEDVYVSNIERAADIVASQDYSILKKDNIIAVVVARREDGLPREHTYGSYFGAHLRQAFLTVPSFEIQGKIRFSGKLDLRTVLTSGTDDFISILDGEMRLSIRPEVSFTGGAILVNKADIGAFWVEERT